MLLNVRGSYYIYGQHLLFFFRVVSIPGSHIVIVLTGHHDSSHDGRDIEVRPCKHTLHDSVYCKLWSMLSHSLFHRHSPLVVNGLRCISIIVSLNQKPSRIRQLVISVSTYWIALDHHTLAMTRNDIVNRS